MTSLVERLRNVTEDDAYALPWTFGETCREAAAEIDRLRRELEEARRALEPWAELCKRTFAIQHNPNCRAPWLVRLPGKGPIDMKPYADGLGFVRHQTGDILGFGKTLDEAARAALLAGEEGK
ncbi:hypothetical protein CN204_04440 [Sinorhizobium meliloti]|uniref:hypothetical protein n=1 Tax=Rhizobium meliloti TaxID=382 RepID=UPI000FD83D9A|nr:hypothetical protein [Sinorhizobium meliloti]RVH87783.1 hypothetical protein CN204_04440 [Sinorhizobium meliloti]